METGKFSGTNEAKDFQKHPVLGNRLREITEALRACENKTADEILSPIDAMKVRSCMTLFDLVSPDDIFRKVLETYYDGQRDPLTLKMTDVK